MRSRLWVGVVGCCAALGLLTSVGCQSQLATGPAPQPRADEDIAGGTVPTSVRALPKSGTWNDEREITVEVDQTNATSKYEFIYSAYRKSDRVPIPLSMVIKSAPASHIPGAVNGHFVVPEKIKLKDPGFKAIVHVLVYYAGEPGKPVANWIHVDPPVAAGASASATDDDDVVSGTVPTSVRVLPSLGTASATREITVFMQKSEADTDYAFE